MLNLIIYYFKFNIYNKKKVHITFYRKVILAKDEV